MNIFSIEYAKNEIKKVRFKEYEYNNIKLFYKTLTPINNLQGYMETRVFTTNNIDIPVFTIDNQVWMSCTPMEMASHYVPIKKAKGRVGVAGLGMGYYILRIMNKKSVKSIDLYEIDEKVINIFKKEFSNRKGFEKINFIQGNLFDNLKNTDYDFFYNDIYPTLGSTEAIDDMKYIKKQYPKIKNYHYWGLELDFYDSIRKGSIFATNVLYKDKIIMKVFSDWCEYTKNEYLQFEDSFIKIFFNIEEDHINNFWNQVINSNI